MTPFWGRDMRRRSAYARYRPSCQAGISAARRRILSLFLFSHGQTRDMAGTSAFPRQAVPDISSRQLAARDACALSDGHSWYRSVRAISLAWRRTSAACEPAPSARQKRILPEGSSRRPARPPPLPCPFPSLSRKKGIKTYRHNILFLLVFF